MKVFVEFVGSVFFVDLKLSQNPLLPTTNYEIKNKQSMDSTVSVNFRLWSSYTTGYVSSSSFLMCALKPDFHNL